MQIIYSLSVIRIQEMEYKSKGVKSKERDFPSYMSLFIYYKLGFCLVSGFVFVFYDVLAL